MKDRYLVVDDVRKSFGGVRALHGLSLHCGAAQILGIIGPNGSGKTTLLNVVSGVYSPDAGRITLNGGDITVLSPWHVSAAGVARTFQNIRLFSSLSILDNVMVGFHRRLKRSIGQILGSHRSPTAHEAWARREAAEILALVDQRLAALADRRAGELSYADQRRVEIARALATRPSLLLLDEPTAGMNPAESREIVELVQRLSEQGIAVLLVEHNMPVIRELAARVVVMDHGEKIAEGPYGDVRKDPRVIECYLGTAA